jgi:hypothetical protein
MSTIPDYYTNSNYWQVYDCGCGQPLEVSPIPRPETKVECICGRSRMAGEEDPTTYAPSATDPVRVVTYPQPE